MYTDTDIIHQFFINKNQYSILYKINKNKILFLMVLKLYMVFLIYIY